MTTKIGNQAQNRAGTSAAILLFAIMTSGLPLAEGRGALRRRLGAFDGASYHDHAAPRQPDDHDNMIPFTKTQQLFVAVDEYMSAVLNSQDPSTTSACQTYGFAMDDWDVSKLTQFNTVFSTERNANMQHFNENIGSWDVSMAWSMDDMFLGAAYFNQNISGWDVSSVESFASTFKGAKAFNANVGRWRVTDNCRNMSGMFMDTVNFNQDISSWDVSGVVTMESMFENAKGFNQDIGKRWDVSSVTDMGKMFFGAGAFDQNLCNWGFLAMRVETTTAESMFAGTHCPELTSPAFYGGGPWCHRCGP